LIRVTAPLPEAQLIETTLLNVMNFHGIPGGLHRRRGLDFQRFGRALV
jgi:nicotinic acid phosphoribosyltransferase